MSTAIEGLEPASVWNYFEELSAIPRESGNESAFREYLVSFSEKHSLGCKSDTAGNILISKAASPGNEAAPGVVIQGHMDMVCVKTETSGHNFLTDPISLVRKGDWMYARDTTLGADNGIAIAMALALLADKQAEHGPLEALFTVSEETGLDGALGLDGAMVTARKLINLDSEEEGVFIIGCAGGSEIIGTLPAEFGEVPATHKAFSCKISGLLGGHSGGEIHAGRGNSIQYGARFLNGILAGSGNDLMIAAMSAGSKRNVIPSTFTCTFTVDRNFVHLVDESAAAIREAFAAELADRDPGAVIELFPADLPELAVSAAQSAAVIRTLYITPNGPYAWSTAIAGLVETSCNLAVVALEADRFVFDTSQRSSVPTALLDISQRTKLALETCGAKTERINIYPSWTPNMNSPFAALSAATYETFTGSKPEVTAIHAGLECGVINSKISGMDSISFGPDIKGAHSVDERLNIASTTRTYDFLKELLKAVCREL